MIYWINYTFEYTFPTLRSLPADVKKKYKCYMIPHMDKLSKTKTILSALTIGGFKYMILWWVNLPMYIGLVRLITYGADHTKPYSKTRSFLLNSYRVFSAKIHLW